MNRHQFTTYLPEIEDGLLPKGQPDLRFSTTLNVIVPRSSSTQCIQSSKTDTSVLGNVSGNTAPEPLLYLRHTPSVQWGKIPLADLPRLNGREVFFKTDDGAIYCIAPTDDGRLACYNTINGTGNYLLADDFAESVFLTVGEPACLAGMVTRDVTEIHIPYCPMSAIRYEFLSALSRQEA